jgi:hypothetical protein
MGTRGMYGFYKEGETKATYNHFDSYLDGLGNDVAKFVRATPIQELNEIFDRVELVDDEKEPTEEQIKHCEQWSDFNVSTGSPKDWYCLLRNAQGNLDAYKVGLKYMSDGSKFIKDSLFCEWAYIINLDDNVLEIYKGFQKKPQDNRYKIEESDNGYWHCALIKTFPLGDIPENWIEQLGIIED